jgi:hypothetical protein
MVEKAIEADFEELAKVIDAIFLKKLAATVLYLSVICRIYG